MTLAFELSKHSKKCIYKAIYKKMKTNKKQGHLKENVAVWNKFCLHPQKKKKRGLSVAYCIFPIATQNAYLG